MNRINAYTRQGPNDTVQVDAEGMLVDLITILKAVGHPKELFLKQVDTAWESVIVEVDTSGVIKQ